MLEVPDHLAISFFKSHVDGISASGVHQARCIICGDSQSRKQLKRMYLLKKRESNTWIVYCHNCGSSLSLYNFVRFFYPEYFETFKSGCVFFSQKTTKTKSEEELFKEQLDKITRKRESIGSSNPVKKFIETECVPISQKPEHHEYLVKRKIKEDIIRGIFYCTGKRYTNRIIIPFYNLKNEPYYFQARSTQSWQSPKYLNWRDPELNEWEMIKKPEYNEFNVDVTQTVFIVEGLIDSTFLKNAVSTIGVKLSDDKVKYLQDKYPNRIFLMDNDKDGKERTKLLFDKYNEKCFVFPNEHEDIKDLNDLGLKLNTDDLTDIVLKNSFRSKMGELEMFKNGIVVINKNDRKFKPKMKTEALPWGI